MISGKSLTGKIS